MWLAKGVHGEINEPRGLSTWYVCLACNNINILMHVRSLNNIKPITKQKLYHSTDLYGHISFPGDCHNMVGK